MDQSTRRAHNPKITPKKFARIEWDPNLRERKTMTDYLAAALRAAIYDGQFADNEELNQVELANFFGVSRVPIREALRQLQAEKLVLNIAHHRTVVAGLTLEQILEAIEMRAVLEGHLLRKSAPRFEKADIARIREICEQTDLIKDYGSRWVLKNWEFHRALYSRSESPSIIETVERIQLNIERYARRAGRTERLQEAAAEHWQIAKCIERKEFVKASDLLERHIMHTGEEIRRQRESDALRPTEPLPTLSRKRGRAEKGIRKRPAARR